MITGKRSAVITGVLSVLIASCSLFYSPLKVISWTPGSAAPADPETIEISVVFNRKPDRVITEEAFSISCLGEEIPGRISWNKATLLFTPYDRLAVNSEFTIRIDTSAEISNGISLNNDFTVSFRTGSRDKRPAVTAVSPADQSFINNRYTDILISFDRVMNFDSLLSGFSISPDINGLSAMDSTGRTFIFTPVEAFELQEEYTVELSAATSSSNGYRIADEYEFGFTISEDNTPPRVTKASSEDNFIELVEGHVTSGWEKDSAVRLHFTEEVDHESAENSISIEPAASFETSFDELASFPELIISFTENLEWHILYRLTVSTALKDTTGNNMEHESVYKLFIDGASSAPPELRIANFIPDNSTICFFNSENPAAAIDSHRILDTSTGDAEQNPFYFDFYFTLADGARLPFFEFTENFLISPEDSCITLSYLNFQIFNPGESTAAASAPQPTPSSEQAVLRLVTSVNDTQTASGIIRFSVYSDLTDSLGNSMSKDWNRELFDEDN